MIFYVTLVSSRKPLNNGHIKGVATFLGDRDCPLQTEPEWLSPDKAADLPLAARPTLSNMRNLRFALREDGIDIFITSAEKRRKKLLVADMDSTIVTGETLDELAAYAGIKDQIAAITARAMNGELDFKEALRERVALLKGLPETTLRDALAQTRLNQGAKILVEIMKKSGTYTVLVSGGFTCFTAPIAERCGFDAQHGNVLNIEDGKLAGTVGEPILDKDAKLDFLERYCYQHSLHPSEAMAIGDGANDLPMLLAAGLGIGFHPKPILEDQLENCILHGDLTAALYAQGYKQSDFLTETAA